MDDTVLAMSSPRLPEELDPLTEVLRSLRITGTLYCTATATAPWGIDIPSFEGVMMVQMVSAGTVWLEVPNLPPRRLGAGTVALIPRGEGHTVRSDASAALTPLAELPVTAVSDHYETTTLGGGGELTRATYGILRFDHLAARRLLDLLPPLLVVDAWESDHADWLASTLRLIAREASRPRPGGELVITRLADVLVVQTIRTWLESDDATTGWLAALRDPRLGRVLAAVHRAPAAPWSLESLAQEAGMSRSTFAAHFSEVVGEGAMSYVTDWRMQLARTLLMRSETQVGELASRVGYGSEAAFGRAFKRAFGTSPGRLRRRTRT